MGVGVNKAFTTRGDKHFVNFSTYSYGLRINPVTLRTTSGDSEKASTIAIFYERTKNKLPRRTER